MSSYDLKSVKIPRLAGPLLRLFVELAESPATRWAITGQLLQNGGVYGLRKLKLHEQPTFQPSTRSALPESGMEKNPLLTETFNRQSLAHPQAPGFAFNTTQNYAHAYSTGKIDPLAIAERILAAIESSHPPRQNGLPDHRGMGTFSAWDRADLLAQAQASAERHRQGRPLGPLDGVPVAVKDEVDMLPFPTTVGTRFLGHSPALQDATVVARLRAAGALLIGKTNMHEIGIGVTGHNTHHGVARNPYDPQRHTGGSSSGSAAAVASGLCPIAVGADGGGSIRLPAGLCGVVGLKPTFGRVSERGAAPLCWSVAHLGPLAATAHDAALGYLAMAGPDPHDSNTLSQPPIHLDQFDNLDLRDLRLGIFWPWFRHAAPEVVAACERMVEHYQRLGATIVEIEIPGLEAARVAHLVTISSEMNAALAPHYERHHRDYSLEVRLDLALARSYAPSDYILAQQVRTRTLHTFQQVLQQVDAILTPTAGVAAPLILPDSLPNGDSDLTLLTEIMRFSTPANLTGLPAISFPAGYTEAGLPVGMQAIAKPWREDLLLRLAHAAEAGHETRRPQVFYDLL